MLMQRCTAVCWSVAFLLVFGGSGTVDGQISRLPPRAAVPRGTNPYAQHPQVANGQVVGGYRVIADRAVGAVKSPAAEMIAAAKVTEKNGDVPGATKMYRDALAKFPNDRQVLVNFARFKHRNGELDGAIVTYQQCLKHYPQDAVALNDLGLCYSRKGEMKKAVGHVESAVRANPGSRRYRNNLATLFVELNQLDRAAVVLCDVHGKAIGNYNLAYLLNRRDRNSEAIQYLQAAVTLDPTLRPAHQLLAKLSAEGGTTVQTARSPSYEVPAQVANAAVQYEERAGVAQPPEVEAYPIPGMVR